MYSFFKRIFCLILILILAGCGERNSLAPVTELKSHPLSRFKSEYVVRRGDTLYAIAFGYDTDFRQLARLNHLNPPYRLRVGQVLNVQVASTLRKMPQSPPRTQVMRPNNPRWTPAPIRQSWFGSRWQWPVRGQVASNFFPAQGKKGINIASEKGGRVHAASGGVVAYAGNGLSGYGNLIIIKHDNEFLTAYGNNSKNLVSEGQRVKAGQVIAFVGVIDRKYWGVHFEIRKQGVPVNPLNYLQKG